MGAAQQLDLIAVTMLTSVINHEYQHGTWMDEVRTSLGHGPAPPPGPPRPGWTRSTVTGCCTHATSPNPDRGRAANGDQAVGVGGAAPAAEAAAASAARNHSSSRDT